MQSCHVLTLLIILLPVSNKLQISKTCLTKLTGAENYALSGFYAASNGTFFPTFLDNLSVHSSMSSSPKLVQTVQGLDCLLLKVGRIRSPETSVQEYISTLYKIPKERRRSFTPRRKPEIMQELRL